MPTITAFEGMKITMFFRESEHDSAHFHVFYCGKSCEISVDTGDIIAGTLKTDKHERIKEWWNIYCPYLYWMWDDNRVYVLPPLPRK